MTNVQIRLSSSTKPISSHMAPTPEPTIQTLHKTLTNQATTLLSELSAFRKYLDDHSTTTPIKPGPLLGKFQVDVQRELNHLLKYSSDIKETPESNQAAEDLDGIHRIRSSNITFLGEVWDECKRRKGITGIRKGIKYVCQPPLGLSSSSVGRSGEGADEDGGLVGRGDVNGGVRGVSKKMNREARERVKMERKLKCLDQREGQGQNQSHDQITTDNDVVSDIAEVQNDNTSDTTESTSKRNHTVDPNTPTPRSHRAKESVTVDIIADHGATWIKMFTKNQRWLLLDLAKEGIVDIEGDDSTSSDDNDGSNSRVAGYQQQQWDSEAMEELKLVKMGREFLAASRSVRVGNGHRHPRVVFCLSKITKGAVRDVDLVLEYLASIDVEVVTVDEAQEMGDRGVTNGISNKNETIEGDMKDYDSGLLEIFRNMASMPLPVPTTETLNVDCTILIALISDISHSRRSDVTIPEHYKGSARRDIEVQLQTDVEDPLLPNHIYPILQGRRLVCTSKATEHWRNIVRIMGSPSEAERCRIYLGETDETFAPGSSARDNLQKISVHNVPGDLQLPLAVVDFDLNDLDVKRDGSECSNVEIDVMRKLATEPRLSSLNSSVFFHGWYRGLTTVSLNRVVSEWLIRATNVVLDDLELRNSMSDDIAEAMRFSGTNVLVCGRERSLLGSEK